jgi:ectoine hydroxylase-related dioxygenase (phytanoyl-CoA dioxygenase family)
VEAVAPLVETGEDVAGQAEELGYLFFRGALEQELVLRVRHAVLSRCAARGWLAPGAPEEEGVARPGLHVPSDDEAWVSLQAEAAILPEVEGLRRHPFVLDTLERVLGRAPETGRGDVFRVTPPAAPDLTTPPHQDAFYLRASAWTVWIPLGGCPLRLGGLAVVPGSHREGLLEHGDGSSGAEVPAGARWASTDYGCGDVLLFSSLTLHGALENRSDGRLRLSVDLRYG